MNLQRKNWLQPGLIHVIILQLFFAGIWRNSFGAEVDMSVFVDLSGLDENSENKDCVFLKNAGFSVANCDGDKDFVCKKNPRDEGMYVCNKHTVRM